MLLTITTLALVAALNAALDCFISGDAIPATQANPLWVRLRLTLTVGRDGR